MKEWHPGGKLLGPAATERDFIHGGSAKEDFVIAERAPYYPYIHVRDLRWLKATCCSSSRYGG